jgi:hypothetical protein
MIGFVLIQIAEQESQIVSSRELGFGLIQSAQMELIQIIMEILVRIISRVARVRL